MIIVKSLRPLPYYNPFVFCLICHSRNVTYVSTDIFRAIFYGEVQSYILPRHIYQCHCCSMMFREDYMVTDS